MAKLTTKISILDVDVVIELIKLIEEYQDQLPDEFVGKLAEIHSRMLNNKLD